MKNLSQIIDGCSRQERRSQQLFYEQYHRLCLSTAFRHVQSFEKAMEVTQHAFLNIFRHLRRFEVRDKTHLEQLVCCWIKKIVTNSSIDYLRWEKRHRRCVALFELTKDYADTVGSPDDVLLRKELVSLTKLLPPAYQRVFNLYAIEGYSHPDIAKMLNITSGTSKSNLSKARTHLQKILGQ
jgi:RNA polymerase sigma-70 factor (ECF subfamily)